CRSEIVNANTTGRSVAVLMITPHSATSAFRRRTSTRVGALAGDAHGQASNHGDSKMATKDEIRPFSFHGPEGELAELRRRVNATRWPDQEQVTDDSQVGLAIAQKLARYWATEHDWRKVEARLNALPNFIIEINGLDIHFIHVRSKHDNALPMIV